MEKALSEKAGRPITLAKAGVIEGFPHHSNKRIKKHQWNIQQQKRLL
jgi:hypothetical protein